MSHNLAQKCPIIQNNFSKSSRSKHVFLHHRNLRKKVVQANVSSARRVREVGFFLIIKYLSIKGANSKGLKPKWLKMVPYINYLAIIIQILAGSKAFLVKESAGFFGGKFWSPENDLDTHHLFG